MMSDQQGTSNMIRLCELCKRLKRKCSKECHFAPHFSTDDEPNKIDVAFKVFDASYVYKMLLEIGESERGDAVDNSVWDPVYGCIGVIPKLQQRRQSLQDEINAARAELQRYKNRDREPPQAPTIPARTDEPLSSTTTSSNHLPYFDFDD